MGSATPRRTSRDRGFGRGGRSARHAVVPALALVVAASASTPALPPLDPVARTAVAAADDDTDRLGEAVVAVLDAVRERSAGSPITEAGGAALPEPLDVAAMLADPEAWRGRPVRVAGRLEQIAARPEAGTDVVEWFIRTAGGPVAVLLVDPPSMSEGRRVAVNGWVIRRAQAIGRDGLRRTHPLVVAAAAPGPAAAGAPAPGTRGVLPLVALAAAATLLVLVRRMVVRSRRDSGHAAGDAARLAARRRARDRGPGPVAADAATLPPDAADALATLRRAADEPASGEPVPRDESRP